MWREVEPRASRLWIRHLPRRWPGAPTLRADPVTRRLVWPDPKQDPGAAFTGLPPVADLAYLPAADPARAAEVAELAARLGESGPVLAAHADSAPAPAVPGVVPVFDLADDLVAGRTPAAPPRGALVVVPLLPHASGDESSWAPLLEALAASAVEAAPSAVVGLALDLLPSDRRRLVEVFGESAFEAVHHRALPALDAERAFARAVAEKGLSPFFERPSARQPSRAARNRELAATLAEAGERWLVLGRSEAEGAALLAAGRHVAASSLEIAALARERQLGHLPFLSATARAELEVYAATGRSPLVAELRAEWIGAGVAA